VTWSDLEGRENGKAAKNANRREQEEYHHLPMCGHL